MEKLIFSTNSIWFKIATEWGTFPKNKKWAEHRLILKGLVPAETHMNEIYNVCHYRWCIIKGLLILFSLAVPLILASTVFVFYPIFSIINCVSNNNCFPIETPLLVILLIDLVMILAIIAILEHVFRVFSSRLTWIPKLYRKFFPKVVNESRYVPDEEYKESQFRIKIRMFRTETHNLIKSLKDRFCVSISFDNEE